MNDFEKVLQQTILSQFLQSWANIGGDINGMRMSEAELG